MSSGVLPYYTVEHCGTDRQLNSRIAFQLFSWTTVSFHRCWVSCWSGQWDTGRLLGINVLRPGKRGAVEVAVVHATASGEPRPNSTCPGGGTVHRQYMGSIPSRAAVDRAARVVTRRTGKAGLCCCDSGSQWDTFVNTAMNTLVP
jgi:hypothetical protein